MNLWRFLRKAARCEASFRKPTYQVQLLTESCHPARGEASRRKRRTPFLREEAEGRPSFGRKPKDAARGAASRRTFRKPKDALFSKQVQKEEGRPSRRKRGTECLPPKDASTLHGDRRSPSTSIKCGAPARSSFGKTAFFPKALSCYQRIRVVQLLRAFFKTP